jgi:predicted HD phosphohydrolase
MPSSIDVLFDLVSAHGQSDYVGEAVSQLQHMLQAALSARNAGSSDAVIAAALLHDVGHMLGLSTPNLYQRMGDCGTASHEGIGAAWVEHQGLPLVTAELVRRHVDAKRYLCFKDPVSAAGRGGRCWRVV